MQMGVLEWCLVGVYELGSFGIGIYFCVIVLLGRSRGIRSKSWPIVEGIISKTEIGVGEASDDYGNRTIYFIPEIHYSYEFGGARYTSSRVSFEEVDGSYRSSRREAVDWLSRYPEGTSVRVYCNPRKPQESVLEPGFRAKALVKGLCVSLFFVGVGVIALVLVLRFLM